MQWSEKMGGDFYLFIFSKSQRGDTEEVGAGLAHLVLRYSYLLCNNDEEVQN